MFQYVEAISMHADILIHLQSFLYIIRCGDSIEGNTFCFNKGKPIYLCFLAKVAVICLNQIASILLV